MTAHIFMYYSARAPKELPKDTSMKNSVLSVRFKPWATSLIVLHFMEIILKSLPQPRLWKKNNRFRIPSFPPISSSGLS